MTHFGPEEWADFARRNMTVEDEARMQDHLETGCEACVQTLQLWLGVLEVASGLNVYSPPDSGLRFVKALYRAFPPQRPRDVRVDVARLVIPQLVQPSLEGVRAPEGERRHFMFQRGNLLLDVQIEARPDEGRISMAGQILDPVAPSGRFGERPVTLLSEDAELAKALTNQFGEFHLEFGAADDLILVIQLESESLLVTPLPSGVMAPPSPDSGLQFPTERNDATN